MSKQRSTLSKQHSTLLPQTATMSNDSIVKVRPFNKVDCCFDIVAVFDNNVAGFGNNVDRNFVLSTMSKQIEHVQFVSTLSKVRNFVRHCCQKRHSTMLLRHCCWCGPGFTLHDLNLYGTIRYGIFTCAQKLTR